MMSLKMPRMPKLIKTPRIKKMKMKAMSMKTGPWSGGDVAPTFAK